jgi:hypothetical protein
MPPSRACDRCYAIKARCSFTDAQDACDRCFRLRHRCVTNRREGKAGRPRTRKRTLSGTASQQSSTLSLSPTDTADQVVAGPSPEALEVLKDFDPSEVSLAQYLTQDQRLDRRFVNSFGIDSFFTETMESSLIRQLLTAPDQVKDALLALAGALKAEEDTDVALGTAATMQNMEWCCNALQKLRLSESATEDDAKAILFVADCLVTVNDLTVGHGFLPIAQAALLAIKPWLPRLMSASSAQFDSHLVPLVFAEIMECSKCGEIPTIRWNNPDNQLIERSYGIAQEALPFLYDICALGHDIKHSLVDPVSALQRADDISTAVDKWTPQIQPRATVYQGLYLSQKQRSQIIRHASCYKLLASLLLAQLTIQTDERHAARAQIAHQIQAEVATFLPIEAPQALYLLWPYFVASTELEDSIEQSEVLANMKDLSGGIATQSCNCMYNFLQFVWHTRAIDPKITWLELVESGTDFSIGP